jgi:hypothetical protein
MLTASAEGQQLPLILILFRIHPRIHSHTGFNVFKHWILMFKKGMHSCRSIL